MMLIYSFAINQFINSPTKQMMKHSLDSMILTNNNKKNQRGEMIFFAGRKCFLGWKWNSAEKNNLSQALESGRDHLKPF